MKHKDEQIYLSDILDSINKIENYTNNYTLDKFAKDLKTIDAVIRNFEIIGEATKQISPKSKASMEEIPWIKVIAMRNKMIHEYSGVDPEILWETIESSLPILKRVIKKHLKTKK